MATGETGRLRQHDVVRLGLLAASRIARSAVLDVAPGVDGIAVTAVAARSADRAEEAARRWGIPHAFGSYRSMLDSDTIDAVYVGTPAALHRPWTLAALAAGRHVLCEKPFAANAADARLMADAASRTDLVLMEALHWRYHPMVARMAEILASGEIGAIRTVEGWFDAAGIPETDIRWNLALGGGSTMDLGVYPISMARWAVGDEPRVIRADAVVDVPGIDTSLSAEVAWDGGVTGTIRSSMRAEGDRHTTGLVITGASGVLRVESPHAPQRGGSFTVETAAGALREPADPSPTYHHQLVAFRDAVLHGHPYPTTADDAVRTMAVIDACYRAAGLEPRPSYH